MHISTHTIPDAHPVHTGWVDNALATVSAAGDPLGALVGRPLGTGAGIMFAGWPQGGPDRVELVEEFSGRGTAPPRYMQVVAFDGPRSAQWAQAEQFAATRRLWPATRDIPGVVRALRLRAGDNGMTVVTLAESADAIDEVIRAVMTSALLPEEDPAMLTGPDRSAVYRLVHADLPMVAT